MRIRLKARCPFCYGRWWLDQILSGDDGRRWAPGVVEAEAMIQYPRDPETGTRGFFWERLAADETARLFPREQERALREFRRRAEAWLAMVAPSTPPPDAKNPTAERADAERADAERAPEPEAALPRNVVEWLLKQ